MNSSKSDFTQGSILGKLIPFMVPILGALVLQAAYGAVDLLVVGRFGTTSGLSAVSTGSQVLNLVTFVITQFSMGITVLIARYIGEKKPQYIGALIGSSMLVFTIICRYDWIFTSDCGAHAGTEGSCRTDFGLCAYLRWRYLFYCGIQRACSNFQGVG